MFIEAGEGHHFQGFEQFVEPLGLGVTDEVAPLRVLHPFIEPFDGDEQEVGIFLHHGPHGAHTAPHAAGHAHGARFTGHDVVQEPFLAFVVLSENAQAAPVTMGMCVMGSPARMMTVPAGRCLCTAFRSSSVDNTVSLNMAAKYRPGGQSRGAPALSKWKNRLAQTILLVA